MFVYCQDEALLDKPLPPFPAPHHTGQDCDVAWSCAGCPSGFLLDATMPRRWSTRRGLRNNPAARSVASFMYILGGGGRCKGEKMLP